MGGYAWVTLATNDSYSLGALVLAHSLRHVGTSQKLAVLITPGVTSVMREKLGAVFDVVQEVNILDSKDEDNLRLLRRPELGVTFTKLHCWRLTQFEKCVFLDADTMVLANCDELFEREELSAAPDVGWPDCFNSGVFVYRPSLTTYSSLIDFALEKGSFDGGDQGLLNLYFSDWAHKDISKHLPFIYNMCSTASYSYLPAFKQFGQDVKIVHFIGAAKPWLQYFNSETKKVSTSPGFQHLHLVLQLWWDSFCANVHSTLSPTMGGLAGAFAQLTLGEPRPPGQSALEDHLRRQGWEVGNIDYMGRDSFDNIWKKICETLSSPPAQSEPTSAPKSPSPPPAPKSPSPPLPPATVQCPAPPAPEPVATPTVAPQQEVVAPVPKPPVVAAVQADVSETPKATLTEKSLPKSCPAKQQEPKTETLPQSATAPAEPIPPPQVKPDSNPVPRTPIVTEATPPTSPPIGALPKVPAAQKPALDVSTATPETPPPAPPPRKGGSAKKSQKGKK